MKQIKNLQAKIDKSSHAFTPQCSSVTEQSKSLEFLGLECDDLNIFRASFSKEITAIKANLEEIAYKVEEHSQAYSRAVLM